MQYGSGFPRVMGAHLPPLAFEGRDEQVATAGIAGVRSPLWHCCW